jgi:hypothetical protein
MLADLQTGLLMYAVRAELALAKNDTYSTRNFDSEQTD